MKLPLGYAERGDVVVLTMTRDDYHAMNLLLAAGIFALRGDRKEEEINVALANRLNKGNPNFDPFMVSV